MKDNNKPNRVDQDDHTFDVLTYMRPQHPPITYDGEHWGVDDDHAHRFPVEDYHEFFYEPNEREFSMIQAIAIVIILAFIMVFIIAGLITAFVG